MKNNLSICDFDQILTTGGPTIFVCIIVKTVNFFANNFFFEFIACEIIKIS